MMIRVNTALGLLRETDQFHEQNITGSWHWHIP